MPNEPIAVAVKRAYPSFIAGLAYPSPDGLDRRTYCAHLEIGSKLNLTPEPDNKFDADAIALFHEGNHLGYVPAKHHWVARSIDEGDELICLVDSIGIDEADPDRAFRVGLMIGIVSDGDDGQPPLVIRETPEMHAVRERYEFEDRARRCCVDGLRVLAYLALLDGVRSPEERNIEISVIESRLLQAGIERDVELANLLGALSQTLEPTKSSMARSVNIVAKNESYFRLIYDSAMLIADFDGTVDNLDAEVIKRLKKAGMTNGWL